MARREKKPVHKVVMTEGKRIIVKDMSVYCIIELPKVAKQKRTLLQVHFGHNCKALYHDSLERCCA